MENKQNQSIAAVVLAAGEGKRMQSELPKVLHEIAGKPLLFYLLETLQSLQFGQVVVVLKHKSDLIANHLEAFSDLTIAKQGDGYGTGKALEAALNLLHPDIKTIVVVYADNAMFVKPRTYQKLIDVHNNNHNTITLATREVDEPKSSGKIVRDETGKIIGIVEKKDATQEELAIKEVNPGLYAFDKDWVAENIEKLTPSPATQEYYVTDLVGLAIKQEKLVEAINMGKTKQWQGVTTQQDITNLNQWIKENPNYE